MVRLQFVLAVFSSRKSVSYKNSERACCLLFSPVVGGQMLAEKSEGWTTFLMFRTWYEQELNQQHDGWHIGVQ